MTERFNPPPNWPEPPHDGWTPPADFRPQHEWGPVPAGWRLWLGKQLPSRAGSPLQLSEDVPASGAQPRARVEAYPVSVLNPGMWTENHLQAEDYGFEPAKPVKNRPRLRLALTIVATVVGFLLAAATVVLFVQLTDFAVEDLPGMMTGWLGGSLPAPPGDS